jgi:hypothetical protein
MHVMSGSAVVNQKNLIRAATVAALLTTGTAMATPLALGPGAMGTVPNYDGRTPTQTTLLAAACGYFSGAACTTGTSTSALESTGINILLSSGGFIEAAGTTDLNPYGSNDVALAFIFGGAESGDVSSVTLSSLAGYSTSVEACGPIFGSEFEGCAATAGTAMRSSGTGNSVTFSGLGTISIEGFPATDGYVLYTDAPVSALVDPNNISVTLTSGTTLSYSGFGLTPPHITPPPPVPEPGTLALLGVGLLGVGLGMNRRRRAR